MQLLRARYRVVSTRVPSSTIHTPLHSCLWFRFCAEFCCLRAVLLAFPFTDLVVLCSDLPALCIQSLQDNLFWVLRGTVATRRPAVVWVCGAGQGGQSVYVLCPLRAPCVSAFAVAHNPPCLEQLQAAALCWCTSFQQNGQHTVGRQPAGWNNHCAMTDL
jgi:hypothetical protein